MASTDRKRLEAVCIGSVLVLAAVLRLWRLEANGFGTEYYAAGVRSALQGGALLFYNSFDPAGLLSLDKPPVAFWIQAAFAKGLGFSGWTIHLPQALAGVASVALLYRLVRRPFGIAAGTIAALALALMPIAVAIDRSNNTDSWLVLFLLLAAWAALRGRGGSLVLAMALLGVAFNVKMMAAFVCGPALLTGWWATGTLSLRQRLQWMAAAGVTLAVVSLAWPLAFDLTPRDHRPYAGSTESNSMLELAVAHNGLERFVRVQADRPRAVPELPFELYDAVPVGALRLATPRLATQFAWLLPLSLIGLFLVRRRDRIDASLLLWGVWLSTYGIVFSAAGGIFHLYYLSALAPPVAALAGLGAVRLWRRGPGWLAIGLALCAAWQIYLAGESLGWMSPWLAAPAVAVIIALLTLVRGKRPPSLVGGMALLVLPAAWALSAIFSPGNLTLPSASLARWLGLDDGRGPVLSHNYTPLSSDPKLLAFLTTHRGDARFVVAAPTTGLASPVIVRTGLPAMAYGGFFGNEPVLTVEMFAEKVKRGEVRYTLLGGLTRPNPITRWVRANGRLVAPSEWLSMSPAGRWPIQLYDMKPN